MARTKTVINANAPPATTMYINSGDLTILTSPSCTALLSKSGKIVGGAEEEK